MRNNEIGGLNSLGNKLETIPNLLKKICKNYGNAPQELAKDSAKIGLTLAKGADDSA